jgi:hypothetical protein
MINLYVSASPIAPFNIRVFEDENQIHQELCFLSELDDRVIILDNEYNIENNYIQGNKQYIAELVKIYSSLNFKIVE